MKLKQDPAVQAVLSIRVYGEEAQAIPLKQALEWMASALVDSKYDEATAVKLIETQIRRRLGSF